MERDALLAAGDRNLATVLWLYARTAPGAVIEDDGGLVLVSTLPSWPGPYHNGALRLDRTVPAADVLARAETFFADRAPGYCVWVAAHADADIEEAATAAGYARISATGAPRMALEHRLAPPRPGPGVSLDEVVDEEGRRDYLAVATAAYAETSLPPDAALAQLATIEALHGPGVRSVVARRSGVPVAAAMVVGDDAATGTAAGPAPAGPAPAGPAVAPVPVVAGIQMVGTVPSARGRGLGELCTAWAADAGFALGAQAVVLEASEAGEPLYRRMGFTEISRYRWCFGPPPRR